VARINKGAQTASRDPALVECLVALGAGPATEDAASFAHFIDGELQRAARIVQEAGIKLNKPIDCHRHGLAALRALAILAATFACGAHSAIGVREAACGEADHRRHRQYLC
jgi:hypothetical protein